MKDCSAIILAGGKSSRMGQKKATLTLRGKTFLEIIIGKLRNIGITDIVLSGFEPSDPDVKYAKDIYQNKGPLAGVHAGLKAVQGDFTLVLAEDAPLVPEDFLKKLIESHMNGDKPVTVAVCGSRLQPLVAVYDCDLAGRCDELLQGGGGTLKDLIREAGCTKLAFEGEEMLIRGCNTQEEYEAVRKLANTETVEFTRKNRDGSHEQSENCLLREFELDIYVDGAFFSHVVCTDEYLKEMVYGRLCTEGIIRTAADVRELLMSEDGRRAEVSLCREKAAAFEKETARVPDFARVFALADAFGEDDGLHKMTGAAHRCILSYRVQGGEEYFSCEDIGRFNAIDKAEGYVLLNGIAPENCMLFTSGRIFAETVKKAANAGIPVLVSKSVPTADAVDAAKAAGICLMGRAWKDSCEVYA